MNKINDWREEFHEVRVFVDVPVEFTVTVKASNDYDAEQEVITILNSMNRQELIDADQYGEEPTYERDSWQVLGVAESHGFDNTPKDLIEANLCAWNLAAKITNTEEDES